MKSVTNWVSPLHVYTAKRGIKIQTSNQVHVHYETNKHIFSFMREGLSYTI